MGGASSGPWGVAAVALSCLHFRSGPGLPGASPEAFDPRPPLGWPRSILFNPDGCCLYSGCQDSLRVYGWEPERCFDVVLVHWGKVLFFHLHSFFLFLMF